MRRLRLHQNQINSCWHFSFFHILKIDCRADTWNDRYFLGRMNQHLLACWKAIFLLECFMFINVLNYWIWDIFAGFSLTKDQKNNILFRLFLPRKVLTSWWFVTPWCTCDVIAIICVSVYISPTFLSTWQKWRPIHRSMWDTSFVNSMLGQH